MAAGPLEKEVSPTILSAHLPQLHHAIQIISTTPLHRPPAPWDTPDLVTLGHVIVLLIQITNRRLQLRELGLQVEHIPRVQRLEPSEDVQISVGRHQVGDHTVAYFRDSGGSWVIISCHFGLSDSLQASFFRAV